MNMDNFGKTNVNRRKFFIGAGALAASASAGAVGVVGTRNGSAVPTSTNSSPPQPERQALLNLARVEWEGGSDYWRQFSRPADAGWSDPAFFPLAVFFGRAAHAEQLKSVGINTFQGVEHNSPLTDATSRGVFCIVQNEFSATDIGSNPNVVGLFANDECDIGLGCSGENTNDNLLDMRRQVSELSSRHDGRFINANYSKGILDSFWAQGNMDAFMDLVDVASTDNYAYTSPDVGTTVSRSPHWPTGTPVARAATYGWLVDRMRSYQNPRGKKPNWILVETAMPFLNEAGARTITPEEIEGACWSAIIHEARGIVFFQHNNDGINGGYSLVECIESRKQLIRAANAKISALARVLNTQSYVWEFGPGIDTMLKEFEGSAYIFAAVGLGAEPGVKTFALPPGIKGTTIEVVDEDREIEIRNSLFTDLFDFEYTHHIYRLAV